MEKRLNFREMSNINAMEELSVSMPAAWYEVDDCSDCDCSKDDDEDDDDD